MAYHDGHERAEDRLGKKYLIVNLRQKWEQVSFFTDLVVFDIVYVMGSKCCL